MRQCDEAPLTTEQRSMVEANMGLVGVNLKRYGRNFDPPRSHRERDDLFQEGCLALMRAARNYPVNSPIPFAAYALPRIRNAMTLALERGFTNVKLPLRRRGKNVRPDRQSEKERHRPHQVMAGEYDLASQEDKRRHDPGEPEAGERIGDRLRERYDRAVQRTVERMGSIRDKRGDLHELVSRLAEDRLSLPSEDARASLREIAAQTRSSYARVHSCEQRMMELMREALDQDLIFCSMREEAMRHDEGVNAPLDQPVQQRIRGELEREFLDHYRAQERARRWMVLVRLFEVGPVDEMALVQDLVSALSDAAFELLIDDWGQFSGDGASTKSERSLVRQAG